MRLQEDVICGLKSVKRPNAAKYHDPRPAYIKALLLATGLSVPEVCGLVGISQAALYRYMCPKTGAGGLASYPVQVCLEKLAVDRIKTNNARTKKQIGFASQ
ncbi:MAG: helix-turn-helix transcriptional regulator [Hyphomicrobium sp.]